MSTAEARPGSLAGAILELEEERRDAGRDALPEDVLPGVGDEAITLRDSLRIGGTTTFARSSARSADALLELARAVITTSRQGDADERGADPRRRRGPHTYRAE